LQEERLESNLNKDHVFSHTSLDLWRLCKRQWWHRYVNGDKQVTTDNMAAGTWLVQEPIEAFHRDDPNLGTPLAGDYIWANFLAEFGGDDSYEHPVFTPNLPKQVLSLYKQAPVEGVVFEIEKRFQVELKGGVKFQSKPDLVVERMVHSDEPIEVSGVCCNATRTAWDIKLKTFWARYPGATPEVEPLLPFDDQGLGQALAATCDHFGQIRFYLDKRSGNLHGPVYVEEPVSRILLDEWENETVDTILEIESHLAWDHTWPKNDKACKAFGRVCAFLEHCKFGATREAT